jgi:hypothetical protein
VWGLARLGETSFMMVVSIFLGCGLADEAFVEDRKKMAPGVDFDRAPLIVPAKLLQLRANLDLLDRRLADGRPFLLGDAVSYADLSAYHPLMMAAQLPVAARLRDEFDHVSRWLDRVAALGHGTRTELDAKDAVEIARAATPAPVSGEPAPLPEGLGVGDAVVVIPEEVGSGVVRGELLSCTSRARSTWWCARASRAVPEPQPIQVFPRMPTWTETSNRWISQGPPRASTESCRPPLIRRPPAV